MAGAEFPNGQDKTVPKIECRALAEHGCFKVKCNIIISFIYERVWVA
jgi:hypothetical protein